MRIREIAMALAGTMAVSISGHAYAQQTGIAVCDDFTAKYEACMKKQAATVQPALQQSITQMRTTFKTMADNPQTKPSLEAMCRQMADQTKAQLTAAPYNCEF